MNYISFFQNLLTSQLLLIYSKKTKSKWQYLLIVIFLFGSGLTSPVFSQVPFANKYVKITNVHSKKVLCTKHYSRDVKSMNNQERIIQYSYTGDPTHIWYVKSIGNGLYLLENVQSKKVLCTMHYSKDVKSKNNQERIIQYSYTGDATHKWRFKSLGSGKWSILNVHSGKALCTMHYSKDPKSKNNQEEIIQYSYTGDPTHQWQFEVVSKPNRYIIPAFVNKYVKITNVHSKKVLCTKHYSKDAKSMNNQEKIIQYSYTGDPTHIWYIKSIGNGLYLLENAQSKKVLCTSHSSKDAKSKNNQERIIQYNYTGDATHKWRFKSLGSGKWSILNAHSGKALCTMHYSKDPKSKNNQEEIIQYSYTGDPTHQWQLEVVSKPNRYVAPKSAKESGFRIMINGIQCLQTGDGGNSQDEIYIDVFVDGKKVKTIGPRSMNEADEDWQRGLHQTLNSGWKDFAKLVGAAKEEFWLMPGSFYAENSVEFKLWEDDEGGQTDKLLTDDDDYLGSIKYTKSHPDGNFMEKSFQEGSGRWRMVCTKKTRKEVDLTVVNDCKKIPVRVPILDQGKEGACVAFAVVGALTTSYLNKTKPGSSKEELFDPMALYKRRANPSQSGWNIPPALNEIMRNGIPFKNSSKRLKIKSYFIYHKSGLVQEVKLSGTSTVSSTGNGYNKMRAVLKAGEPLICRYDYYDDFTAYAGEQGVYGGNIVAHKSDFGHAVFLVGYNNPGVGDNRFPTWILQNSWGADFGKKGLCRFAEGACGFDDRMYKIGEIVIE